MELYQNNRGGVNHFEKTFEFGEGKKVGKNLGGVGYKGFNK